MKKVDILIFTAIAEEFEAVIKHLEDCKDEFLEGIGTYYKVGKYRNLRVGVTQTEAGNSKAGIEVERGISAFQPKFLFFTGVAGGVKDVKIGDVVAGTKVSYYEPAKISDSEKVRLDFGNSDYNLVQKAKAIKSANNWQSKIIPTEFSNNFGVPAAYVKPIATGEKVVANRESEVFKLIKKNCSDALAVEMEGFGFLEAKRPYPLISALLVRGISDMIDEKSDADNNGSQYVAASNAAAFTFAVIDFLPVEEIGEEFPIDSNIDLYPLLKNLYKSGLREQSIWERSDGDLSFFNLSEPGQSQWWNALVALKNGGGGNISFDSLIKNVKIDFPNNSELKKITESSVKKKSENEGLKNFNKNTVSNSTLNASSIQIGDVNNYYGNNKRE